MYYVNFNIGLQETTAVSFKGTNPKCTNWCVKLDGNEKCIRNNNFHEICNWILGWKSGHSYFYSSKLLDVVQIQHAEIPSEYLRSYSLIWIMFCESNFIFNLFMSSKVETFVLKEIKQIFQ